MHQTVTVAMDPVSVARWQFAITTVYHFLFVPLTIGTSFLVAGFQTAWHRTGQERYYQATKFWGRLFLINFALGLVTGIVQEFQFGMNWSEYSRFVGDIFGSPLAIEALLAFFLESTFLGLWIFGWERLPRAVHLACIWIAAFGTMASAYFILAANSFMQHPVGYVINELKGRAELTDFWAVITQKTTVITFLHVLTACFLCSGAALVGISCYHLRKKQQPTVFRPSLLVGLWALLIAGVGVGLTGDQQGKVMFEQQPMKMASAEALWDTQGPAPFSLFAVGDVEKGRNSVEIEIPRLLSFLAHGNFHDPVPGINQTNAAERAKYGPGDYRPWIPMAYWSFRWMIGFGMFSVLVALFGLWFTRRGRTPAGRWGAWFWRFGLWTLVFPVIGSAWGWIFTETGRQPWIVYGLMRTREGVSTSVPAGRVLTSLILFTALYAVLAVVEVGLCVKYARAGAHDVAPPDGPASTSADGDEDQPLAFAY
ncbi:cytochrome ubiquinol oxidase subunit I [Catenulispora sp. NF23]|uniref:Cytochrome ubiquinol oxidase subunit I n=1 Tax=Catenulispora pinistramenti TaxID=2705254 RepID=A0ABS5KJ57_9ACTN|nr:cytochrome ubiquinol oxidase subunit I [Catenulispora pinistramenti]MBS2532358.1 cytochrome ubiquinol oxidase subunit I [Catenulispora pinistramenti]MBS2546127.1 cytochrome ubiquinol oxidase subunit I [Catenulispora pinistramenti]